MPILPISLTRVSNLLQTNVSTQQIDSTNAQLLTIENQLSTGKQINTPSDNPATASVIEQLNKTLTTRQAYSTNINAATSTLGETDSTLGDLTALLRQAQSIASANVGSTVSDDQRQSAAIVVQSIYSQVMTIANKQFNNTYLFGDDGGQKQPFVQSGGGVQYTGSGKTLSNSVDSGSFLSFQADGSQVFGGLSSRVLGDNNVTPALTAQMQLSDVAGAAGGGIRSGPIQISDGTVTKVVDLSNARSIGDVADAINNAGVGSIVASISGQGITLSGGGSENITVTEIGNGNTANSLGIATGVGGAGAGTPVNGTSVNPRVTQTTLISSLRNGLGVDTAGLTISNGTTTKTITFPAGGNVQDLLNSINGSNLGATASINSSGTGIEIVNNTQGATLTVGENGGATASELGVQSMSTSTPLSQLNNGTGVNIAGSGQDDFQVTRMDGSTFEVSLDGATTVQDVIDDINTSDGGGGVTASFSTTGGGIVLTDMTGGGGTLTVTGQNYSTAATDLGLNATATGSTITAADVNGVQSSGIFGNLKNLITSLQSGDTAGITESAQALTDDTTRVVNVNGAVGAAEQQLQSRSNALTSENTATQSLLSTLQDTDFATAVTKYQTLQTALQASLQVAAQSMQHSLLDYLS